MKKYFLVLLLSLLISLSMSCKINYIDIIKLYHNNYDGRIFNEYKRMYNMDYTGNPNSVRVEFLKSTELSDEEYLISKEEYGFDFVNILAIAIEIDYGTYKEKRIFEQIFEFDNRKTAENVQNNFYNSDIYCLRNNILFIENSANYLLLGDKCTKKNNFLVNDDIFLRTYVVNNNLSIPNDITKVANFACRGTNITSIICGESLEVIGYGAFGLCDNLEKVIFNKNVKKILTCAFASSNNLGSIIIPSSVEYIGEYAFTSGTLYCEASEKPDGWDDEFAASNVKVYWKDEWYYDDNNIPRLNSEKENI